MAKSINPGLLRAIEAKNRAESKKRRKVAPTRERPTIKGEAVEALPIGDDRTTSGSVSELQGALRELTAILCGAAELIECDEANGSHVENPLSAAAELMKLALLRCEQLEDLVGPGSVTSPA